MALCLIPDWHPARFAPPVVYLDAQGQPWRNNRQGGGNLIRLNHEEARALLMLGAAKARKPVTA